MYGKLQFWTTIKYHFLLALTSWCSWTTWSSWTKCGILKWMILILTVNCGLLKKTVIKNDTKNKILCWKKTSFQSYQLHVPKKSPNLFFSRTQGEKKPWISQVNYKAKAKLGIYTPKNPKKGWLCSSPRHPKSSSHTLGLEVWKEPLKAFSGGV